MKGSTWDLVSILFLGFVSAVVVDLMWQNCSTLSSNGNFTPLSDGPREVVLDRSAYNLSDSVRNVRCNHYTCLNVYRCDSNSKLSVFVYPETQFVDKSGHRIGTDISREFNEILSSIRRSDYAVADPSKACLFVPAVDLLDLRRTKLDEMGLMLSNLEWWNNGENHLLFNLIPSSYGGNLPTGLAMVADSGQNYLSHRRLFDISIPFYSAEIGEIIPQDPSPSRKWLLLSAQMFLTKAHRDTIDDLSVTYPAEILSLRKCNTPAFKVRCSPIGSEFDYTVLIQRSEFCLIVDSEINSRVELSIALKLGCIPVLIKDQMILPFNEVLDWKRAAVLLYDHELSSVHKILQQISVGRREELRSTGLNFYQLYMISMNVITSTVLQILSDRILPHTAKTYADWNDSPSHADRFPVPIMPLIRSVPSEGFTAVILTYDRVNSLFHLIKSVAKLPSLSKILVLWNNQLKKPPPRSFWPNIGKPLDVIQTDGNKLSNRFYPYVEIETEAILSLDDDILMLNEDEIEFGYQTWREFPDSLVGFPSRVHLFDNFTQSWRYDSTWLNEMSLVLTSAAFYHKYYHHLYTNYLQPEIRDWVDTNMNCEDIAMNFLIANATGKPSLKVTPRKRFRCANCPSIDLSADVAHMTTRSDCLNRFSRVFGNATLKTVQYRVDPVLLRMNLPKPLQQFSEVGPL